jgi:hypothetical protein
MGRVRDEPARVRLDYVLCISERQADSMSIIIFLRLRSGTWRGMGCHGGAMLFSPAFT